MFKYCMGISKKFIKGAQEKQKSAFDKMVKDYNYKVTHKLSARYTKHNYYFSF